mmetsp:Transcript_7551/g.25955  ORF Transcript_7551/g.25955 Transcript_7551/m.25955 type:complete len:206 (+) Transcript_7551:2295-2912(+)
MPPLSLAPRGCTAPQSPSALRPPPALTLASSTGTAGGQTTWAWSWSRFRGTGRPWPTPWRSSPSISTSTRQTWRPRRRGSSSPSRRMVLSAPLPSGSTSSSTRRSGCPPALTGKRGGPGSRPCSASRRSASRRGRASPWSPGTTPTGSPSIWTTPWWTGGICHLEFRCGTRCGRCHTTGQRRRTPRSPAPARRTPRSTARSPPPP